MKYKTRRWYLKGIYGYYENAINEGKRIRRITGASYKIEKKGILGDYELWVTKRGF